MSCWSCVGWRKMRKIMKKGRSSLRFSTIFTISFLLTSTSIQNTEKIWYLISFVSIQWRENILWNIKSLAKMMLMKGNKNHKFLFCHRFLSKRREISLLVFACLRCPSHISSFRMILLCQLLFSFHLILCCSFFNPKKYKRK